MSNINFIKNFLEDLHKNEIVKKIINLSKNYPSVKQEISMAFIEIEKVIPIEGEKGIEQVINWTLEDLEDHGIVPIAGVSSGNLLCLGVNEENKNQIFYFDYDFGMFKLDNQIKELIDKLEEPIDYDSLTDEELYSLSSDEYWLNI